LFWFQVQKIFFITVAFAGKDNGAGMSIHCFAAKA
jgi:hypothetical protein